MKTKVINFNGGGTLIYTRRKGMRHTAVIVGFRAGSFHEKHKGVAHFLEHMLFQGTNNLDREALTKKIKEVFSYSNASTSPFYITETFDRTNKMLTPAMQLASEMLFESNLPEEHIETEKGVIKEEYRLFHDKAQLSLGIWHKQTLANKKSACSFSYEDNLGSLEDIDSITRKDLIDFKDAYFTRNNFVSVVETALPLRKIKKLLEENFLNKMKENNNPPIETPFAINKKGNMQVVKYDRNKFEMAITFKFDKTYDEIKNNLNYNILRNHLGTIVFHRLREKGLVYDTSLNYSIDKLHSDFRFTICTSKEKLNDVLAIINDGIKQVVSKQIEQADYERIKKNFIYSRDESQPQKARDLIKNKLNDFCLKGEVRNALSTHEYKKELNKTSLAKIQEAAQTVFNKKNDVYITILSPYDASELPTYKEIKKQLFKNC